MSGGSCNATCSCCSNVAVAFPAGFSVAPWTRHHDARVRYEAIHLQLTLPAERDLALLTALDDHDLRIMRLGLVALQDECPPAMAGLVVRVALNPRIVEELRVLAVGALSRSRERVSLEALRQLVDGGRTLLGRPRLAPRTPVFLAAVRALASAWASEPRAADMLALANGSSDPEVRQAARPGDATMSDPVGFLNAFAHALAVMTLYPEGHPSRERAIDAAHETLDDLWTGTEHPSFTFLEDEVVFGRDRLRELKEWDWGRRLMAAGVQRLEFERQVSRDEFESFLQEILARLTLSAITTSENRQMAPLGIRFGAVGLQGQSETEAAAAPAPATMDLTLGEEAETLRWLQEEVRSHGAVPLVEAEAVVRSLSVAMHSDRRMVLPLLQLKEFDQYTTTHSLNVAVLAMGLAEHLECGPREVRAFGVAGLLHDIGKIRIPLEVLTKPGKLSDEERRVMNQHPIDGARIIMASDDELDLAAVVAYEHHIMLDGGGYPAMHYGRECALASRLVHVCDVFDALRTRRPYRDAWASDKVMSYLEERAGTEFDPELVTAFNRMLRQGEAQVRVLGEEA